MREAMQVSSAPVSRSSAPAARAIALALGAFVVVAALHTGVPELRHDWRLPADPSAFANAMEAFTSGWTREGIGEPQSHPTFYLIAGCIALVHGLFPPIVWIALIVGGGIAVAAANSYALSRARGASVAGSTAIAIIASCNPWVYAKIVAGHIFMVLAYALTIALITEIARPIPRRAALLLLGALAIVQIQFFLIIIVPYTVWCIKTRRFFELAAALIAIAPIAVGVAGDYDAIRATPYNYAWQKSMSIPPLDGALLTGYVFHYASAFAPLALDGVVMVAVALSGAWRLRYAIDKVVVVIGCACWIVSGGADGIIAPVYATIVAHVPESGVYRELYDIVAATAIGYLVLLASAIAGPGKRVTTAIVVATGAALLTVWCIDPPTNRFVASSTLPRIALPRDPAHRVALLPAFQPLSYEDRGSGVDPDAYDRAGASSIINEATPTFPVDTALAFLERDDDAGRLHALAVDDVIDRPGFRSDAAALATTSLLFPAQHTKEAPNTVPVAPFFGTMEGLPPVVGIADDPRTFGRFFGDLPSMGVEPMRSDHETTDFRAAWVDARLAFRARPSWGTMLGGIATASHVPISIPPTAIAVLAQSDEPILDAHGRTVAAAGPSLRWWPTHADERVLRCSAACIVIATSRSVPPRRENGPTLLLTPDRFEWPAPWLALVHVPSHGRRATLRFAERYDDKWIALDEGSILAHLRLAGSLNGWLLPPAPNERTIIVAHWLAIAQAALEIGAALFLAIALSREALLHRYARRTCDECPPRATSTE